MVEHQENPKKKSNFTQESKLMTKSPQRSAVDAKISKQGNLQSQNPDIFGNTGQHTNKYNNHFDHKEIN